MNISRSQIFFHIALLFLCLVPWALIQINLRIPGDAAFLYSGMQMLLDGKMMSEYFYDTNPPMSFLIYTPAAILHYLGLSHHVAIQIYTLIFTLISFSFTAYFLSKWKTLSSTAYLVILSCYLFSVTLLPYIEYAQKDHFIAIAVVPFLLMQLNLTYAHKTSNAAIWIAALLYVPFILVKPHFGLLPTILIAHRFYLKKNLTPFLDADFISLTVGVILYWVFIAFVTPDFITEIIPASLSFYISHNGIASLIQTSCVLIFLGLILISMSKMSDGPTETKSLAMIFSCMATLSVIAFLTQAKGFSVHLLPIICLFSISVGLTLYLYTKDKFSFMSSRPIFAVLAICAVFYLYFAMGIKTQTQDDYKNSSLARMLEGKAGTEPYFMETYSTNIVGTQNLYIPNEFASRFPSLWFLFDFNDLPREKQKAIWEKYGTMIAGDFERSRPKVILLVKPNAPDQGFLALFKDHPAFKSQWAYYAHDGEFTISKDESADFLLQKSETEHTYDIYIRITD